MAASADDRVALVVITRNRVNDLLRTLSRLAALPERPRIVVVDNASTDGTSTAVGARHPEVRLVRLGENRGSAARNAGVAATGAPYVGFCDDDSWWEPGALSAAADLLDAHPRLALVNGHVLVDEPPRVDPVCLEMARSPIRPVDGQPGRPVLSFIACAAVVRWRALQEVGGFLPFGVGGEEEILGEDLAAAGWTMSYVPEIVAHHHPSGARDARERRVSEVRNALWTAWLRRPGPVAARRTLAALRQAAADPDAARGLLYALAGLWWVMRRRRVLPERVERMRRALEAQPCDAGLAHLPRSQAMPRFTSPLAEALAADVLDRFLRYVRIDTQAQRERTQSPSTPGQLDLSRLLVAELRAAGLADAELDDNGYVFATLPATVEDAPVVGLVAHVDTSPDAPGAGVEPIVHRDYDGGVIELPRNGTVLDPETMPALRGKAGEDIVSTSGDTLLGADDKAGVAEIVAAVSYLAAHPELPRPTIRVGFTPDEEIGEGATLFDVERFGAACAYTMDGSTIGELQDETFTAAEVIATIHGVDLHPGFATGKLVNAARLAGAVLAALPSRTLTPETTSGREGFIHVYELQGTAAEATIRAIVRDFDDEKLDAHVGLLRRTAERVVGAEPRAQLDLTVRHQYPNMRSHLQGFPEVVGAAERALRAEGIEPLRNPIRGGTDGSALSAMGLPTPNLFAGGHEFHSVREWVSVQDMAAAAATIVRLADVWTQPGFRDAAVREPEAA